MPERCREESRGWAVLADARIFGRRGAVPGAAAAARNLEATLNMSSSLWAPLSNGMARVGLSSRAPPSAVGCVFIYIMRPCLSLGCHLGNERGMFLAVLYMYMYRTARLQMEGCGWQERGGMLGGSCLSGQIVGKARGSKHGHCYTYNCTYNSQDEHEDKGGGLTTRSVDGRALDGRAHQPLQADILSSAHDNITKNPPRCRTLAPDPGHSSWGNTTILTEQRPLCSASIEAPPRATPSLAPLFILVSGRPAVYCASAPCNTPRYGFPRPAVEAARLKTRWL